MRIWTVTEDASGGQSGGVLAHSVNIGIRNREESANG